MDTPLLVEHVRRPREGHPVERPVHDFTQHRRLPQTLRLEPRPALIIEGILIFENRALRDLMDIKIFVARRSCDRYCLGGCLLRPPRAISLTGVQFYPVE